MKRIMYGSTAAIAGIVAIVTAVWILGTRQGIETPVHAQSPPSTERLSAADNSRDPAGVTTVKPSVESIHRVSTQPAQIEPFERTNVYAKAAGFLEKVTVDIGERVEKDQVLANLWIPEMDQELLRKQALAEQAQAAVQQAQARLDSTDALVAAAEASRDETQAAIAQHEADIAFRRSEHGRIVDLVKSRSVNEAIQDEKLKQLRSSEATLAAALARVRFAEANVLVEQAKRRTAQADVSYAQSQSKVTQAELRQTEILMKYAQVRAPYAGQITRRWVNSGDFVASASNAKMDPLFTVDRIDKLRIVFDVPEADSALVRVGQHASLVVDALKGRTFEGQVMRTAGVLDPKSRTLRVEAEVTDPNVSLRAGMYGMVTVTLAERVNAVLVPARSLHYEGTTAFVLCVKQGVVERRLVKVGYSDGIRSEILEGLDSADQVILESRVQVHPGQKVRSLASRQ